MNKMTFAPSEDESNALWVTGDQNCFKQVVKTIKLELANALAGQSSSGIHVILYLLLCPYVLFYNFSEVVLLRRM